MKGKEGKDGDRNWRKRKEENEKLGTKSVCEITRMIKKVIDSIDTLIVERVTRA